MLSVGVDRVRVEAQLLAGELGCPECGAGLAPWGSAAPRFVGRADGVVDRFRPRRAICSSPAGCGRSHVLLPRTVLGRRVDEVSVIWEALIMRARGLGWRRITAMLDRPVSTVRGWLIPAGGPVADAVAQIGAACAAVRRRFGIPVLAVSPAQMVAACSGGRLLGARRPPGRLWINTSPTL